MVREMCDVLLRHRKRNKDLMLILGLYETIDQLSMANSVYGWYDHVLVGRMVVS